jgi:arylsulfatase A
MLHLSFLLAAALAAPPEQPNIIVILADDLGQGDVAIMNDDARIPTPNLDRLALQGARFTDAHSPSAVCTPTRYGLLTGRYCWRTSMKQGVLWGKAPLLIEDERPTIASELKKAGYHTAFVGKWHLGLGSTKRDDWSEPFDKGPHTIGFDESFGIPSSLDIPPYCWVRNGVATPPPTVEVSGSAHRRKQGGGFWRKGLASPGFSFRDVLPDTINEAIQIVETPRDKPLFLYVALSAPHTPWLPLVAQAGTTEVGHYGDFVASVDAEVGRLLASIDDANTIVVFTSDNGAHWPTSDVEQWKHDGNNGRRGQKADIHEGGHRIPLFVRWPSVVEPNSVINETVCLTDLYETSRAVAGLSRASLGGEDSVSWVALLTDGDATKLAERDAIIHHSLNGMFAIRTGDWKLVDGLGSGGFTAPQKQTAEDGEPSVQLYDLAADPAEITNVAADHPEVVARLSTLLEHIKAADRSVTPPDGAPLTVDTESKSPRGQTPS